ncbi:MAG TPA: hypothetical protein DCS66_07030 [Flavobacteriaceae bacterium]|nr:hypothetical protein [Flavobacteriaceae bacterium]HAT64341.1 hypothetical protein [Flavobacteriaceae bacterium]|tara:strand:+ start:502 stop:882 length:381 start_codon:yes stop_codon:yes gene_type:complete
MISLVPNNDYGIWGYVLGYFPALFVLLGLLVLVCILDFLLLKIAKSKPKTQIYSYGILGIILSVMVLSTFYQGTFNETVYLSFPAGIVGVWVVFKFLKISKLRLLSLVWLGVLLALIIVGLCLVYF